MKRTALFIALLLSSFLLSTSASAVNHTAEIFLQFGHANEVISVAFSPDGKTLASGSGDKTIKLWDVASGQTLRTLSGTDSARSVAFSPTGQILASAGNDGTIKLWDVDKGQELRTLGTHSFVFSVAFNPDGKILASGNAERPLSYGMLPLGGSCVRFMAVAWGCARSTLNLTTKPSLLARMVRS